MHLGLRPRVRARVRCARASVSRLCRHLRPPTRLRLRMLGRSCASACARLHLGVRLRLRVSVYARARVLSM